MGKIMTTNKTASIFLALGIFCGLGLLGFLLGGAAVDVKLFDRSVTVKGLAEREIPADVVIWPIQFAVASNDLTQLYDKIEQQSAQISDFLQRKGIGLQAISSSTPAIIDKSAQPYGGDNDAQFRYTANQIVTVYSRNIELVRQVMVQLSELGKSGIALTAADYSAQTEYLFTRLNDVKPQMVEEATNKAREVAEKFAKDSQSQLGKIKRATQGQFSISARDRNNPHIKKIRVVSTVEYYLAD